MKWKDSSNLKEEYRQNVLYIHIGTHKTGTTSIQTFLTKQRSLLAHQGICVPHAGTLGKYSGHHNIAWQLRGDPRFNIEYGDIDKLLEELVNSNKTIAVISSEDLEYLVQYPNILSKFECTLQSAGWYPTYIVFFRSQESYAKSLYVSLLNYSITDRFDEFISEIIRNGRYVMNNDWVFCFEYAEFVKRWQRGARGHFIGLSYDEECQNTGIIHAFLRAMGYTGSLAEDICDIKENISNQRNQFSIRTLDRFRMRFKFYQSNRWLYKMFNIRLNVA